MAVRHGANHRECPAQASTRATGASPSLDRTVRPCFGPELAAPGFPGRNVDEPRKLEQRVFHHQFDRLATIQSVIDNQPCPSLAHPRPIELDKRILIPDLL